jgi:hypothetical protein
MIARMISTLPQLLRRPIGTVALVAGLIGCFAVATPASARVWIGFGFPGVYVGPGYYPPAYYPPPYYYPPPAYYPPASYPPAGSPYAPQASYAPAQPGAEPSATGQICNAGSYTCPLDQPVASGAACYCLGNGGAHMWGHAN